MPYFLRERNGKTERVWMPNRTADQRSRALSALSGCVVIVHHPYQRHPGSGAGNCWCGRAQSSKLHIVTLEPVVPSPVDLPGRARDLLA